MAETQAPTHIFDFTGGQLCLDFANTVGGSRSGNRREHLNSYADLVSWGRQAGVLPAHEARALLEKAARRPTEAAGALERAIALREAIYEIFSAVAAGAEARAADLDVLNSELRVAMCHSAITQSEGGFAWVLQGDEHEQALDLALWPVARAAADLLVGGELNRVRECGGHTCGWLFMDMSRNRSRQWCDMSDCGNRAKARRHYEKIRNHKDTKDTKNNKP